jgi:hypothetical protein
MATKFYPILEPYGGYPLCNTHAKEEGLLGMLSEPTDLACYLCNKKGN